MAELWTRHMYTQPSQTYIQEISGNKENFKIKDRIQDGFQEHVQKAQTTITALLADVVSQSCV